MISFSALIITIVSSLIACAMGALVSFFITTISQRKVTVSIIKELIKTHEKIYHKYEVSYLIDKHEKNCDSIKELESLRKGLKYLIKHGGGNPEELGFV